MGLFNNGLINTIQGGRRTSDIIKDYRILTEYSGDHHHNERIVKLLLIDGRQLQFKESFLHDNISEFKPTLNNLYSSFPNISSISLQILTMITLTKGVGYHLVFDKQKETFSFKTRTNDTVEFTSDAIKSIEYIQNGNEYKIIYYGVNLFLPSKADVNLNTSMDPNTQRYIAAVDPYNDAIQGVQQYPVRPTESYRMDDIDFSDPNGSINEIKSKDPDSNKTIEEIAKKTKLYIGSIPVYRTFDMESKVWTYTIFEDDKDGCVINIPLNNKNHEHVVRDFLKDIMKNINGQTFKEAIE